MLANSVMLESLGIWTDLRHTVISVRQARTDLQTEKAKLVQCLDSEFGLHFLGRLRFTGL